MLRTVLCAMGAAAMLLGHAAGHAQVFPQDSDWDAPLCGDELMSDPVGDDADALEHLDVVGEPLAPAALRASDDEFLYVRIRVEDDPTTGTAFVAAAWGMAFDVDGDLASYEVLAVVDGIGQTVSLYENTMTTMSNSPADPADEPPVATYALATHARSVAANNSTFGDGPDFFVDFAVPWADLAPLGIEPATQVAVWVGSSQTANALDGDLACHDASAGSPTLTTSASDRTVSDPTVDSDADGFTDAEELDQGTDPNDENSFPGASGDTQLEGGGGCATSQGHGPVGLLLALLFWRRRKSDSP